MKIIFPAWRRVDSALFYIYIYLYLRRVLVPLDWVTAAGGGEVSRFPKPSVAASDLDGGFFFLFPATSARLAVLTRTWVVFFRACYIPHRHKQNKYVQCNTGFLLLSGNVSG